MTFEETSQLKIMLYREVAEQANSYTWDEDMTFSDLVEILNSLADKASNSKTCLNVENQYGIWW